MNIVRRIKNENYTTTSNEFLRDGNISLKAKGLMAMIFALPDDWDFSIKGLCSIIREGKDAIYNTINELKESGYCVVENKRDEKGKILRNDYTFFETPYPENPYPENPDMDNPDMDNPPQINNIYNKILNKQNTKEIKEKEIKEKEKKEKEIGFDLTNIDKAWWDVIGKWIKFKKSIRNNYAKQETFEKCYKRLRNLSSDNLSTADAIVEQSIANNWKGLFKVKDNDIMSNIDDELFEKCWEAYRRKGSKKQSWEQWKKLGDEERAKVLPHIKAYVGTRELRYQKEFERYLYGRIFEEVVYNNNNVAFDPANAGMYNPPNDVMVGWNEYTKSWLYIGPYMDGSEIFDGYVPSERPDGAEVQLNNARGFIKWSKKDMRWYRI